MDTQHEDSFMFSAPRGGAPPPPGPGGIPMAPPMGNQGMPPPMGSQNSDIAARDRLTSYIYEYLMHTGATKTAEAFKEEVMSSNPMLANLVKQSDKSFLYDWWTLFWDLWSAAPERRDVNDPYAPSQEAKYFHENMIGMPPMMNGHFAPPPMGMDMMGGHPGAFVGRFPPGRMPQGGMPPGSFPMFAPPPDPRMQRIPNPGMRMPGMPPGAPFPGPGGMPRPGAPMGEMPGMPRYDFMGPGGASAPFPGASSSGMMPNGGMPHMSLNSPNMGPPVPPPGADPSMSGGFMGMPPMPPTSSFGLSAVDQQPMSAGAPGSGAGAPGTPGNLGNPGSVPAVPTTSVGTPSSIGAPKPEPSGPNSNGEEVKTEALTPGSVGAAAPPTTTVSLNGGGVGTPGSAHSGNNNPGTPSNPLSNPPLSSGPPAPGSADAFKDDNEISKIRDGLLEGFKTEVWGE